MTGEFPKNNAAAMYVEQTPPESLENGDPKNFYDDDGRKKRTGTTFNSMKFNFFYPINSFVRFVLVIVEFWGILN